MKTSIILSVILPAVFGTGDESDQTDYSQHGVNWEGLCATGKRQSPMKVSKTQLILPMKYSTARVWGVLNDFNLILGNFPGNRSSF